jgi:C1A family cysteine protease
MTSPRPHQIGRFGWVPDLPDARDHLYAAPRIAVADVPAKVDLRDGMSKPYDQGRIGSCTANAIGAAFQFALYKQKLPDFMPSRLFVYYNERAVEGSVPYDAGAMIRDGVKSLRKLGVCTEDEWPYDDTPPEFDGGTWPEGAKAGMKPTDECYCSALDNRATSYQRVTPVLSELQGCLADGYPFVFGFSVYSSFMSEEVADSGVVPMPASAEQLLGGHAVLAVGYDTETKRFLVRNSWGIRWGQDGYFTMPFSYLTTRGLASDFWTIRVVT